MSPSQDLPRRARPAAPGHLHIASRVVAAVLGGWLFAYGFVALGIVGLVAAGMPYADAQTLAYLLVFLVYLAAFCWTFTTRSALRAWAVLAGGGSALTAFAWWAGRTLA